ncbi:hypothetical protein GCM10023115_20590 [Pontixanthobacter gangjinensis]
MEGGLPISAVAEDAVHMSAVKEWLGVPEQLGFCHKIAIEGYLIERHVPAEAIAKLLKERP